ncbi:hypothetical protein [Parvularcula marina]|uniref:hypothetical protein n=1 Tax=Parvularcula marina TaxID=2292771 RepID=UPI00131422A0|nr:hypothetical protein [Parvularcula marina]
MTRRLIFTTFAALLLGACTTPPEEKKTAETEDPEGLTCTEDALVNTPRDPVKICRD